MQSALGSGWHSAQQRIASASLQLCWPKILQQSHDDEVDDDGVDENDDYDDDDDDGVDDVDENGLHQLCWPGHLELPGQSVLNSEIFLAY